MYKRFFGLITIGIVIKLMDDFLDKKIDNILDKHNYALILKNSILPYTILLTILALYLNMKEGITFFAASYVLGMTKDYDKKLPTNVFAWQESLIVFIFSIIYISFLDTIYAIILIFLLQLIDDLIDLKDDNYINEFNYIELMGTTPGIILMIILILISLNYFPLKFIYFCSAVIVLYFIDYILKIKFNKSKINNS